MIGLDWTTKKRMRSLLFLTARMTAIYAFNPLECKSNYSATSNRHNMKLVHWPLMGGLLHLVQRGGDWAEPQPALSPGPSSLYQM